MSNVEFNIVYWKDDIGSQIERINKKMEEYAYKIAGIGEWRALIADENKEVEEGKPVIIRIKKVEFPPNSICIMLARMRHALGAVLDVLHAGKPKYVETVSYADRVLFLPIHNGIVEKGDLLGVVNVIYVKTAKKAHLANIISKIEKILEMDTDKLIESKDWPYLFSK